MLLLLTRANEVDESALICAAEMALMAVELNPLIRVVESVLNAVVLIVADTALATRVHAKVNLIPYNTVDGLEWSRPTESACEAFLAELEKFGITATLRREKGGDIDAACGQLRLRTEKELAEREVS